MKIKASEVQIDASYHGLPSVTDEFLGMDEAWHIFKDPYTIFYEFPVIGVSEPEGIGLVRDMRKKYPDIHSPLCRIAEGCHGLVIQYQIGCHDVYIVPGLIDDAEVYAESYIFLIKGAVPIGDDKALPVFRAPSLITGAAGRIAVSRIVLALFLLSPEVPCAVPHLQEEHCK